MKRKKYKKYIEDYFELNDNYRINERKTQENDKNKADNFSKNLNQSTVLKLPNKFIVLIMLVSSIASLIIIINFIADSYKNSTTFNQFKNSNVESIKTATQEVKENTNFINYLVNSYNNDDILCFLSIVDKDGASHISFPVVKTSDNSFYKNRGLNKNFDTSGSAFMDYQVNLDNGNIPKNIVIYANDLYKRSPFHNLKLLNDEKLYENINVIEIKFKDRTVYYEIFAFLEETEQFSENPIDFKNETEFLRYMSYVEANAKYFNGISQDDDIITLSTNYNKLNGNIYKVYGKKIYK